MSQPQIETFNSLLKRIRACEACKLALPLGPRPIVQASPHSRILIIGQAPGLKVHESGIPWDDASGDRLREWMGIGKERFYDEDLVAIVPMGFCYPGKGKSGDLPPRKECAPLWHRPVLEQMPNLELVLLVGSHAQTAYLGKSRKSSMTETVRCWAEYLPRYLPLPHPSPLNNIWLHKNRWFKNKELPEIKKCIQALLA